MPNDPTTHVGKAETNRPIKYILFEIKVGYTAYLRAGIPHTTRSLQQSPALNMSLPTQGKSFDDETMEQLFDFDGASSKTSWTSIAGVDSTSVQGQPHRRGSIHPVIASLSPSTICESSDPIKGFECFSHTYPASSAPTLAPAHGNGHCQDTKQAMHGVLESGQLISLREIEATPHHEFVALHEIDLSHTDAPSNGFGSPQEGVHTNQIDASLEQVSPLPFERQFINTQTSVATKSAVMNTATHMAALPFGPERPKDPKTFGQGKRKRPNPPGGFLITDILGCSPWPGPHRTEQAQRERDEVIGAGGSCLLCTFRHKKVSTVILLK